MVSATVVPGSMPTGAAGNKKRTFSLVGVAGSSTVGSVTYTNAAKAGDICIFSNLCVEASADAIADVTPTGFTQAFNVNSKSPTMNRTLANKISYKILTADGAATVTGWNTGHSGYAAMAGVFRPSIPINSVIPVQLYAANTDAGISASLLFGGIPLAAIAAYLAYHGTDSAQAQSDSGLWTDGWTGSVSRRAGFQLFNPGANPANQTLSAPDGGYNSLVCGYFNFT